MLDTNTDKNPVKLIAGRLNNCSTTYYWKLNSHVNFNIGDYAIIENMSDYDLVKIVGVLETNEKYLKKIINQDIYKNVIKIIPRSDIRND
jgi:rhamnose utilization protein RhaD (predicted bifunctional aldolase and dehydrogenase)